LTHTLFLGIVPIKQRCATPFIWRTADRPNLGRRGQPAAQQCL